MHLFIPGAVPLFSTPARRNIYASSVQSSFVDITGVTGLGEPDQPDQSQWQTRMELFDQNNGSFTGNPFSGIASGSDVSSIYSLSDHEDAVSADVEPYYDNHHFPDLEKRFVQIVFVLAWLFE